MALHELSSGHYIDPREKRLQPGARNLADALGEEVLVQGQNLRNIGDRIFRESGHARGKRHVPGGICPAKIAGQWHAHDRGNSTAVQVVPLHNYNRPPEARSRSHRSGQISPPNVPLRDHARLPFAPLECTPGCRCNKSVVKILIPGRFPQFLTDSVHGGCYFFRSVARQVFPDRIAEQPAARFLRAPRKPLRPFKNLIRD